MEKPNLNRGQAIIAGFVLGGFFISLVLMFTIPGAGAQDGMREARLLMLGTLQSGFSLVLGYYFGSTSGSERKSELLANSTPTPSAPVVVTSTAETAAGLTTTTFTDENQFPQQSTAPAEGSSTPPSKP